jgi:UDP-glucose 4-epimerase
MRVARLALTGTASFLGLRLLQRAVETRGGDAVVAIDTLAPPTDLGVRHRQLDLTEPAADERLLRVLQEERVDTLLHLAFFTTPRRDRNAAHEVESIGTLAVMAAAAAAGVKHVVMRSFTAVYGACGQNPSVLTEERPLEGNPGLPWLRDKLEAEQHAAAFARRYPELLVTILRFAPLFGPGVRTFYTRLFDKRVVPTLMGFDPLVQLLHPDDAVAAAEAALARPIAGAVNVVPSRPMPLIAALHLAQKVPIPVPHPLAYLASDALWAAGLVEAPGAFLDYARYPCIADGGRAERELGFVARHSSRDALLAYLKERHP